VLNASVGRIEAAAWKIGPSLPCRRWSWSSSRRQKARSMRDVDW